MGTRNLTFVMLDGEYKVAQYGQWDGYPGGQGVTALAFLRDKMERDVFTDKVRKLRELTVDERKARWASVGADPNSQWVDAAIGDLHDKQYPECSRNTGAEILNLIQNADDGLGVSLDTKFAADSLMCEWAYVVDFDKNAFEVYKGFNKTALDPDARFAPLELRKPTMDGTQYHPVVLVKSYPLDALPDDKTFCEECEPQDDEDADARRGLASCVVRGAG